MLKPMSVDHKPNLAKELKRIIKSGGSVYQTKSHCKYKLCHNLAQSPIRKGKHDETQSGQVIKG